MFRESWPTNPNLQLSMEKSWVIEGSIDVGGAHSVIKIRVAFQRMQGHHSDCHGSWRRGSRGGGAAARRTGI